MEIRFPGLFVRLGVRSSGTIKTSNNEVQVCSKNKSTPHHGEMKNGQIMTKPVVVVDVVFT